MPKRLLDVGNCSADHFAVRQLCQRAFAAEVEQAHTAAQALEMLRGGRYDLVLVNRVFDADADSGLELIRVLRGDPEFAAVPVMLLSNFPRSQAEAVAAGALPGFGKAELSAPQTLDRLRTCLAAS